MFTVAAVLVVALLAWAVSRANSKDRGIYESERSDMKEWALLLHARQDLKLIAFLLAGILIALGVVADRVG